MAMEHSKNITQKIIELYKIENRASSEGRKGKEEFYKIETLLKK